MRKLLLTAGVAFFLGSQVVAAQAGIPGSPGGIRAALQDISVVDQVRHKKCWRHGRNHCRRSPVYVRRYYQDPYPYYYSPYAYYPSVGFGYYGGHFGRHHGGHWGGHGGGHHGGGHGGFGHSGGHGGHGGHHGGHH